MKFVRLIPIDILFKLRKKTDYETWALLWVFKSVLNTDWKISVGIKIIFTSRLHRFPIQ